MPDHPANKILGVTDVAKALGLTFFRWEKYRSLGLIQPADVVHGRREFWYPLSVEAIRERLAEYAREVQAAVRNELAKEREAERAQAESESARKRELTQMYERNVEALEA